MRAYMYVQATDDSTGQVFVESSLFQANEQRGMFLKKLWCCIVGRVQQDYLVLSTDLKKLISHHKEFRSRRFGR